MTEIRQELLNLIARNNAEQWVPEHIASQQLLDRHGDRLIPGLIECLGDDKADVRRLAISLLDEAGPAVTPALPAIIQKIADPDRIVRVAAVHCLEKFGPQAAEAVPLLQPWLQDGHEYIRLLAAITILKIDRTMQRELMPLIEAARASKNPMVQGMADEFIADN